ncbi:MAG TPA: DNA polymerase III subunit delta', partial [Burkholderiales bacterium]|nr:DNA polymerase III subunit delta' [Burkholderiales bacterium]
MFDWQLSIWESWKRVRGHLPHAVLMQGPEGWGEFEFAQSAALSLLCEKPRADGLACGVCQACNWFRLGNHPDFRLVVPESMAAEPSEESAEPGKKRSD